MNRRKFIQAGAAGVLATTAFAQEKPKVTKYCRFQVGNSIAYGIVDGDSIRQIDGDLFGKWKATEVRRPLSAAKLLVPVANPQKVLAVGLNYKSHLGDRPAPKVPEIFFKVPSCLVPPDGNIVLPKGSSDVHYEAELVIVVGKQAKNVPAKDGLQYVFGVTAGNDVSARDWQKGDLQWWRAKGSDTFGPVGPYIVSGINYDDLLLQLRKNGEVLQKQRTSDMIHKCGDIVSWISQHVTLEPGDLIYTGTPGKTTAMKAGDTVEVELEGVGILRNKVV